MIILKKTNSKSIPKANKNVSFGSAFRFIDLFVQKSRLWINPCKNINQLQSHCKISSVPASIDITNRYVSIITFAFRFSDVWCYHVASGLFLSQCTMCRLRSKITLYQIQSHNLECKIRFFR